tara:strand:+ start:269 stop:547 length:279 start_codon:yes stop_codon:yes gene_type:complete
MIDAQKMKNGSMEVVNMNGILRDVVAVIVRSAIGGSPFAPSTSHPHREAASVMVTAEVSSVKSALAVTCATEFASPDHQGVLQQTPILKIRD